MKIEGYVRILAGTLVLISVTLGHFVSPWRLLLAVFVGVNLIQSSFTGFCLACIILGRLGVGKGGCDMRAGANSKGQFTGLAACCEDLYSRRNAGIHPHSLVFASRPPRRSAALQFSRPRKLACRVVAHSSDRRPSAPAERGLRRGSLRLAVAMGEDWRREGDW